MLTNPPLSSAALPGNVLCQYLCSKDMYINVINAYHRYTSVAEGYFPVMQHVAGH